LLLEAVAVLVSVLGANVAANSSRSVVRYFRRGVAAWAYVAVLLTSIGLVAVASRNRPAFYNVAVGGVYLIYGGFLSLGAAAVMAIGITQFVRTVPEPAGSKWCPSCAEKINAAAAVCKHCGYHWPSPQTETAA
jgi:uncharacterized membrane protein